MIRITLACPVDLIPDANQLMAALGDHPDDVLTFTAADYQDAEGNRYAVASMLDVNDWQERSDQPLISPAWPVDIEAAGQAQDKLAIYTQPDEPDDEPFASPAILAAVSGHEVGSALAILGLSRD